GDHRVCGVDCSSLCAVCGRSVGELHVFGYVGRGQVDLSAPAGTPHCEAAVRVDRGHDPAVAVLDPAASRADASLVLSGQDLVTDAGSLLAAELYAVGEDMPGGYPVGAGTAVEFCDRL